jgi:hypothetical protein
MNRPARATGLPDILPTHTAFDDACDFFTLLDYQLEAIDERYYIVHGICVGHALGTPFAHAWVEAKTDEHGLVVWQRGTMRATGADVYFALRLDSFYELFGVRRATRHLGPWLEDYRALCNDTRGGRVLGSMSGVAPVAVVEVVVASGGDATGEF